MIKKEIKYEDLVIELEEIVKELEDNNLDLETSIEKYKRGLEITKQCQKFLDSAKTVLIEKK